MQVNEWIDGLQIQKRKGASSVITLFSNVFPWNNKGYNRPYSQKFNQFVIKDTELLFFIWTFQWNAISTVLTVFWVSFHLVLIPVRRLSPPVPAFLQRWKWCFLLQSRLRAVVVDQEIFSENSLFSNCSNQCDVTVAIIKTNSNNLCQLCTAFFIRYNFFADLANYHRFLSVSPIITFSHIKHQRHSFVKMQTGLTRIFISKNQWLNHKMHFTGVLYENGWKCIFFIYYIVLLYNFAVCVE